MWAIVGSRTGAPASGSGGFPVAFALDLSPTPLTMFPVPAHRTVRADFLHPAFGRDHAFAHGKRVVRLPARRAPGLARARRRSASRGRSMPSASDQCSKARFPAAVSGARNSTAPSPTVQAGRWPTRATGTRRWSHPGADRVHRADPRREAQPSGRRAPWRARHHTRMDRKGQGKGAIDTPGWECRSRW